MDSFIFAGLHVCCLRIIHLVEPLLWARYTHFAMGWAPNVTVHAPKHGAQPCDPACRVYMRQDAVVVGPLSLNITGCPRSSPAPRTSEPDQAAAAPSGALAAALQAVISALVPRCTAVPVSVEQARMRLFLRDLPRLRCYWCALA